MAMNGSMCPEMSSLKVHDPEVGVYGLLLSENVEYIIKFVDELEQCKLSWPSSDVRVIGVGNVHPQPGKYLVIYVGKRCFEVQVIKKCSPFINNLDIPSIELNSVELTNFLVWNGCSTCCNPITTPVQTERKTEATVSRNEMGYFTPPPEKSRDSYHDSHRVSDPEEQDLTDMLSLMSEAPEENVSRNETGFATPPPEQHRGSYRDSYRDSDPEGEVTEIIRLVSQTPMIIVTSATPSDEVTELPSPTMPGAFDISDTVQPSLGNSRSTNNMVHLVSDAKISLPETVNEKYRLMDTDVLENSRRSSTTKGQPNTLESSNIVVSKPPVTAAPTTTSGTFQRPPNADIPNHASSSTILPENNRHNSVSPTKYSTARLKVLKPPPRPVRNIARAEIPSPFFPVRRTEISPLSQLPVVPESNLEDIEAQKDTGRKYIRSAQAPRAKPPKLSITKGSSTATRATRPRIYSSFPSIHASGISNGLPAVLENGSVNPETVILPIPERSSTSLRVESIATENTDTSSQVNDTRTPISPRGKSWRKPPPAYDAEITQADNQGEMSGIPPTVTEIPPPVPEKPEAAQSEQTPITLPSSLEKPMFRLEVEMPNNGNELLGDTSNPSTSPVTAIDDTPIQRNTPTEIVQLSQNVTQQEGPEKMTFWNKINPNRLIKRRSKQVPLPKRNIREQFRRDGLAISGPLQLKPDTPFRT
ncbi:hypothetical protein BDQ17DRAFT_1463372 [Cyathus striatus]|nr:hypothetical protein BDQ17DRAFT_1463372 [Cyathus striatus]